MPSDSGGNDHEAIPRAIVTEADGVISCSIAETNRVRALLGLKPLDVASSKGDDRNKGGEVEVRQPSAAECRDRLAEVKARRIREKLTTGTSFVSMLEMEEEELDPVVWVSKMRQRTVIDDTSVSGQDSIDGGGGRTARGADGRLAVVKSSDDGPVADGTEGDDSNVDDSIGELQLGHKLNELKGVAAGDQLVLTLQDRRVIGSDGFVDDSEDVLENMELMAKATRDKRAQEKGKKRPYDAAEDGTMGPDGNFVKPDVLSHYDEWAEELKGDGRKRVKTGDGVVRLRDLQNQEAVIASQAPTPGQEIDMTTTLRLQTDFLTSEEMEKRNNSNSKKAAAAGVAGFRKIKGVGSQATRRRRRTAEDSSRNRDNASFGNKAERGDDDSKTSSSITLSLLASAVRRPPPAGDDADELGGPNGYLEDADDAVLYSQLARQRRIAQQVAPPSSQEKVSDDSDLSGPVSSAVIGRRPVDSHNSQSFTTTQAAETEGILEKKEGDKDGTDSSKTDSSKETKDESMRASSTTSGIRSVDILDSGVLGDVSSLSGNEGVQLSSTTEFCRVIQTPLEKLEAMQSEAIFRAKGRVNKAAVHSTKDKKKGKDWREGSGEGPVDFGIHETETSMAAVTGGDDSDGDDSEDGDGDLSTSPLGSSLESPTIRDVMLDGGIASALQYLKSKGDLKEEGAARRNPENAPLHTSTERGDVKMEYKDSFGRVMTPKDAFRYISWIFHGKGPGKKKREKMLKSMELEKKLKTIDPQKSLPTLRALNRQQRETGQAHIVLSASSSSSSAH